MQVTEQRFDNALVLRVAGRIDRDTTEQFKAAIQPHLEGCRQGGDVVLLDFSGLQYISSLGFQSLILAQRKVKMQNGRFGIAALQPTVKSIFDVTNFAGVIRCYESVDKALADMSYTAHAAYKQSA